MEDYQYISTLGEGAYGYVWKCRAVATGGVVAVKGLKAAHEMPEIMRLATREVKLLRKLAHPAVVPLLDAFKTKSGRVYMVFPYIGPSCYQAMSDMQGGLPPQRLRLIAWQLLQALAYLHENKVVHRDIKPANVLLSEGSDRTVLIDFGFARATRCGPRDAERLSSYVVTRWYRAPEVLLRDLYGPAADIWSLGCTIAELAAGWPLFPGRSTADQLWRVMRCFGPLPPTLSDPQQVAGVAPPPRRGASLRERLPEVEPGLFRFIEACLSPDPRVRPTAAQLLQSPCFWVVPRLVVGTPLEGLYDRRDGEGGNVNGGGVVGEQAAAAVGAGAEQPSDQHGRGGHGGAAQPVQVVQVARLAAQLGAVQHGGAPGAAAPAPCAATHGSAGREPAPAARPREPQPAGGRDAGKPAESGEVNMEASARLLAAQVSPVHPAWASQPARGAMDVDADAAITAADARGDSPLPHSSTPSPGQTLGSATTPDMRAGTPDSATPTPGGLSHMSDPGGRSPAGVASPTCADADMADAQPPAPGEPHAADAGAPMLIPPGAAAAAAAAAAEPAPALPASTSSLVFATLTPSLASGSRNVRTLLAQGTAAAAGGVSEPFSISSASVANTVAAALSSEPAPAAVAAPFGSLIMPSRDTRGEGNGGARTLGAAGGAHPPANAPGAHTARTTVSPLGSPARRIQPGEGAAQAASDAWMHSSIVAQAMGLPSLHLPPHPHRRGSAERRARALAAGGASTSGHSSETPDEFFQGGTGGVGAASWVAMAALPRGGAAAVGVDATGVGTLFAALSSPAPVVPAPAKTTSLHAATSEPPPNGPAPASRADGSRPVELAPAVFPDVPATRSLSVEAPTSRSPFTTATSAVARPGAQLAQPGAPASRRRPPRQNISVSAAGSLHAFSSRPSLQHAATQPSTPTSPPGNAPPPDTTGTSERTPSPTALSWLLPRPRASVPAPISLNQPRRSFAAARSAREAPSPSPTHGSQLLLASQASSGLLTAYTSAGLSTLHLGMCDTPAFNHDHNHDMPSAVEARRATGPPAPVAVHLHEQPHGRRQLTPRVSMQDDAHAGRPGSGRSRWGVFHGTIWSGRVKSDAASPLPSSATPSGGLLPFLRLSHRGGGGIGATATTGTSPIATGAGLSPLHPQGLTDASTGATGRLLDLTDTPTSPSRPSQSRCAPRLSLQHNQRHPFAAPTSRSQESDPGALPARSATVAGIAPAAKALPEWLAGAQHRSDGATAGPGGGFPPRMLAGASQGAAGLGAAPSALATSAQAYWRAMSQGSGGGGMGGGCSPGTQSTDGGGARTRTAGDGSSNGGYCVDEDGVVLSRPSAPGRDRDSGSRVRGLAGPSSSAAQAGAARLRNHIISRSRLAPAPVAPAPSDGSWQGPGSRRATGQGLMMSNEPGEGSGGNRPTGQQLAPAQPPLQVPAPPPPPQQQQQLLQLQSVRSAQPPVQAGGQAEGSGKAKASKGKLAKMFKKLKALVLPAKKA